MEEQKQKITESLNDLNNQSIIERNINCMINEVIHFQDSVIELEENHFDEDIDSERNLEKEINQSLENLNNLSCDFKNGHGPNNQNSSFRSNKNSMKSNKNSRRQSQNNSKNLESSENRSNDDRIISLEESFLNKSMDSINVEIEKLSQKIKENKEINKENEEKENEEKFVGENSENNSENITKEIDQGDQSQEITDSKNFIFSKILNNNSFNSHEFFPNVSGTTESEGVLEAFNNLKIKSDEENTNNLNLLRQNKPKISSQFSGFKLNSTLSNDNSIADDFDKIPLKSNFFRQNSKNPKDKNYEENLKIEKNFEKNLEKLDTSITNAKKTKESKENNNNFFDNDNSKNFSTQDQLVSFNSEMENSLNSNSHFMSQNYFNNSNLNQNSQKDSSISQYRKSGFSMNMNQSGSLFKKKNNNITTNSNANISLNLNSTNQSSLHKKSLNFLPENTSTSMNMMNINMKEENENLSNLTYNK